MSVCERKRDVLKKSWREREIQGKNRVSLKMRGGRRGAQERDDNRIEKYYKLTQDKLSKYN